MSTLRLLRSRRACWLALLAVWAMACAPTLSHAWAAWQGAAAAEVCISPASGVSSTASPGGAEAASSAALTHSLAHCAYCLLAADDAAPIPRIETALPTRLGTEPIPARARAATPRLRTWARAHPRGPPGA